MLTFRRGVARIGWVSLFAWIALFAAAAVFSDRPPGTDTNPAILAFVGVPLAIFLLWRLLLWILQGFWQQPAAGPQEHVSTALHLNDAFWTARTMALVGAFLFVAFGAIAGIGGLLPNAAIGAILGAGMARFLPR